MKTKTILTVFFVLLFFAGAIAGSAEPNPSASESEIATWEIITTLVCVLSAFAAFLLNRKQILKELQ